MRSASPMLLAGRYRRHERLAAGGFGEVWQATDVVLDRPVAVKVLHPGFTHHPETLARFQVEARHAASLSHENIARVYDYGEPPAAHAPFLVMELIQGPSLAQVLRGGPLAPVRAMDIVSQVAAGLDAAHRAGLVHRDIKPGNLLIGPDGTVKITDFGISYAAGSAPMTTTGMLVGTPAYIAPERVAGKPAGPASDLYSLGVVAHECLSGAPPFTGAALEVAVAHQSRPLPPLPASVPAVVAALVTQLTVKDPAARPASAGAVARHAAWLRDSLPDRSAGRITAPAADSDPPEGARRWPGPSPVADSGPGEPATARLTPSRRPFSRARRVAVAAGALAATAAALILASVIGPASAGHPATAPTGTSSPVSPRPAVLTVDVNGSALIGQPVSAVVSRLRHLGLTVGVLWRRSDQQPPGRVLSVQPGGQLTRGSRVTVTGALSVQPPAKGSSASGPKPGPPGHAKPGPPGHAKPGPPGHAKPRPPGGPKPKPPNPAKPKPPGPSKPNHR